MKKILLYTLCLLMVFPTVSCNDWLDVQPKNQSSADEQFDTYDGFRDALNGCYILLKRRNLYGEKLTMSDIEAMGQLWYITNSGSPRYKLMNFDYEDDGVKGVTDAVYTDLFNVIAQANMIIENMPRKGDVIKDAAIRASIEAEAYAIRAFCHFDILRLFGQVPQSATIKVSLPYAEKVSYKELPPYYDYNTFVGKIESDLDKAESLLKGNDPYHTYTPFNNNDFGYAPGDVDEYFAYRQGRFNYWAVRAIQARFYLYRGGEADRDKAYAIAKEIIGATSTGGDPTIVLSGEADLSAGYLMCPSECLLMLNVYNLMDYTPTVMGAGGGTVPAIGVLLTLPDKLNELYAYPASNRSRLIWKRDVFVFGESTQYAALQKYYYDKSQSNKAIKNQVVPLIRLSEIYLIAIETTRNLAEANSLYEEYMLSHDVNPEQLTPFASLGEVQNVVVGEYRSEFFGEGQMFYTYKRVGAGSMLWRDKEVTEENYIVPLPATEYDPNK